MCQELGLASPLWRWGKIDEERRPNMTRLRRELRGKLDDHIRELLVSEERRTKGALDFMDDLRDLLAEELRALDDEDDRGVRPIFDSLESRWGQLKAGVTDVVTDSGPIDRLIDRIRLEGIRDSYLGFLNEAEEVILRRVRNRLAADLLRELIEHLKRRSEQLRRLCYQVFDAAVEILEKQRRPIVDRLRRQELGQTPDVEFIRSHNVLSQEWRQAFYRDQEAYRPQAVLQHLIARGRHPFTFLEIRPRAGGDLSRELAQTILDGIASLGQRDRQLSIIEVLNAQQGMRGRKPSQQVAAVLARRLSPQLKIARQRSELSLRPDSIVFRGGLDQATRDALTQSSELRNFKFIPAETWESNRINLFAAYLPISLQGCNIVKETFARTYWREEEELRRSRDRDAVLYGLKLFRCFPESRKWPRPENYVSDIEEDARLFARALALSEILDVSDEDRKKMEAKGGPREKRYALFQLGRQWVWLWPFFEPFSGHTLLPTEGLIKLGSNVQEAYETFRGERRYVDHAREWDRWFSEHWSEKYLVAELKDRLKGVIASFQERKSRTAEASQRDLWDKLIEVVDEWLDDF